MSTQALKDQIDAALILIDRHNTMPDVVRRFAEVAARRGPRIGSPRTHEKA